MMPVLKAVFVGILTMSAADGVPNLNVQPSCKAAAEGIIGLKQDVDACLNGGIEELLRGLR